MPVNQDIQLLPETRRKIDVKMPGGNRFLLNGIGCLVIIMAIGFYFSYSSNRLEKSVNNLNSELLDLESKRDRGFENDIKIFKKQLALVSGFIDNHIYWSIALQKLETLLQNKVQLTRLDFQKLESHNEISIGGKTINYSTLAKQLAAFLSDSSVEDIDLQGAETKSSGLIDFNLKLKVKSSALQNE